MRLYLSSYRFGDHVDRLRDLTGPRRRVAVIENALDDIPAPKRRAFARDVFDVHAEFTGLGFAPQPLDLRDYFARPRDIAAALRQFDLIWATGGNTFLLRRAMRASGFDVSIGPLLREDHVAYGGWSAGSAVATPSLLGIDLIDDPNISAPGYPPGDPIFGGLGLIDFLIVPHIDSDHFESAAAESASAFLTEKAMRHVRLRDGGVVLVDGDRIEILGPNPVRAPQTVAPPSRSRT